ncbi:ATP-binding protein [Rhizobium sp. CC-YZS058]|uniref:AAA family ATPase n=1 Tax=Rhizobium sp. CC-YZS058 TaxID=3042153 RepID=UPI002B05253B|nr:ATP-binding protein [Rhizobium sp. CC-YZS058]MEA3536632.1 ATP-binding protein [Rhizobium sp. CC-YZS058]
MDKLTRLLVHRLRQDADRQTLRNALLNGLLELKLVEWDGAIIRRYSPLFDTSQLSGNMAQDLIWIRRHFASLLVEPPKSVNEAKNVFAADVGSVDVRPPVPERFRRLLARKLEDARWAVADEERRAYAIRLVANAGPPPMSGHLIAAVVLAKALMASGRSFAELVDLASSRTSFVTVQSEVTGVETAIARLLTATRLLPGELISFIAGGAPFFDDDLRFEKEDQRRPVFHLEGQHVSSLVGHSVRRRLVRAAAFDLPVLITADDPHQIPDDVRVTADLCLTVVKFDKALIAAIIEIIYGASVLADLNALIESLRPRWLSMDDLILALRPGRQPSEALRILATLAAANRQDAIENGAVDDEDGDGDAGTSATDGALAPEQSASAAAARKQPGNSTSKKDQKSKEERRLVVVDPARQTSGRGKREVSSGAEVVQPEPVEPGDTRSVGGRLQVETLSGYGKARDWALELKADLVDYRSDRLPWTDMSTRLLLSGPPGTGKTTFARALCNSLQIPLVVTSVSTWLEGGYLNDVLRKMTLTFAEARDRAPAILFVDEIDGIGKRQPAERDHADWWNAVVNKALELLDGAMKAEGVIVVGATNRPSEIDEALRRSGRLETHIEIPRPDIPALADILAFQLGPDVEHLRSVQATGEHASISSVGSSSEAAEADVACHGQGVQS